MDGKKTIRNAIIAFVVVGVLGVGIGIYTEAVGVEGSLMENLLAQKQEEASLKDSAEEEDIATEEESNAFETDTTTTDSTAVLREGPYYQYTVTADFGLNIYDAPDTPTGDGGKLGVVPSGTTGFAIGQGNRRTLIQYNGMFGYVSNTYVTLTEVSSEEYPEELKRVFLLTRQSIFLN